MRWWRRAPRKLPIPTFSAKLEQKLEPRPEPIEVIEELDPSDSMIIRVKAAIWNKWKGD
jgi:hypothetical protein